MADKLVPGDSLNEEVFNKFNDMADEVNALKESGVGGGTVDPSNLVTIDGEQTIRGNKYFAGHTYLNGNTNLKMLFAPNADGSNTFTKGTAGQVLKTNGSTVYWGNDNASSSTGSGGTVVELSGESGTLTDEQYLQCTNPTTVIKWLNGSGAYTVYEYWRYISPTIYFRSVYIDADECINNIIEITVGSHGWKRTQATYDGGSQVSVTQTLTSGTKIGSITVDGKTTALYAPEGSGSGGGGGSVPADAIIDVNELPVAVVADEGYLFKNGAKVEEYLLRQVVVHIVDALPEVGEPLLTGSPAVMNVYYQKGDDEAYCYLTPNVKPGYNSEGWTSLESGLIYINDNSYGGIVTDESQATESDTLYLVYKAKNINTKAIYRVAETTCNTFFNGFVNNLGSPVTIHTVDILPATGEPIYDNIETPTKITGYYQKSDGNVYAWLPTAMGVPNDMWMPLESVLATENIPYGGFVTSTTGLPDGTVYLFLEYSIKLYHYKEGWQLLGDGNNKSRVFAISASDFTGEDTTEGNYTLAQLGGHSLIQCTELFSYLRKNYINIASIRYTSLVQGGQGISVSAKLLSAGGDWYLDVNLEGFYQTKSMGLALRDDGVLIYTTDDWNFLALAYFQIVVTTF